MISILQYVKTYYNFQGRQENSMFKKALAHTLPLDGGYSNDVDDLGGETNYGITKKTAMAYGYNGPMKDIPMSVVEDIYKKMFWDVNKLDEVAQVCEDASIEMFDAR